MKLRDNQKFNNWFYNHPKLVSACAFSVVFFLSLLIFIKDYTIYNEKEEQEKENILYNVESNIDQILKSGYVTTLSLALTIDNSGHPKNFENVAKKLIETNTYIDGVELVRGGVVKYVYPYEENKAAIGLNILEYEYSRIEAYRAIENRKMHFAGPLDLKQGGEGIIGRLPIFINNEFWGFSVVIIKMDTFLKYSGIQELEEKGLNYRFTKINPSSGKREVFTDGNDDFDFEKATKTYFEEADWEIYLLMDSDYDAYISALPFLIFGLVLSGLFAFSVFLILKKPAQLKRHIKLQARKLLHSEVKYRAIFKEAGLGIVHIDENEGVLEVNSRFLEMTGYTFYEISRMKFSNLISLKGRSFQKILNLEKFEATLSTKNNSEKHIRITNSSLNLNLKKTHILFIEDITKRKLAENKLKDLQSRMQMAIRVSRLGYWEWELETDKITWSDRMYEIFNFGKEQNLNSHLIVQKVHPDDKKLYKRQIKKILETKKGSTFETRITRNKDGKEEVLHILGRVECEEENGKLHKIKGTLVDVTEKRQALINLQHSHQMVVEQNERLLNFSYIVSHNLRSHSSNIQGLVTHLKEVDSEEEMREMLQLIEDVAISLNETLKDLNEVVHIHKNSNGIISDLTLYDFINRVIKILHREIKINDIDLRINVPQDKKVWFNSAYLQSVLLNIMSNAVKYRDPDKKSEIKITFSEDEKFKILEISDNGIGIDLETNKSNLFGMYKTFTDFKNSRGIGLFVTNNQMQAMGGKIEVSSEINIGSTFTLYFKK